MSQLLSGKGSDLSKLMHVFSGRTGARLPISFYSLLQFSLALHCHQILPMAVSILILPTEPCSTWHHERGEHQTHSLFTVFIALPAVICSLYCIPFGLLFLRFAFALLSLSFFCLALPCGLHGTKCFVLSPWL